MMADNTNLNADLPKPAPSPSLPGHLQDLTARARGYVEAASSANTRMAYASDGKRFAAWCRRSNLSLLLPHPQTIGLYISRAPPERWSVAENPTPYRPQSAGCRPFPGILRSAVNSSIAKIAISPRSWQGSAIVTPGLLCRRKR